MDLPRGISLRSNGHFLVKSMQGDKIRHFKTYKTLPEALASHKLLLSKIDEERSRIIQDDMKKPIIRNENGVAFLRFKNVDVLLDDDIYLKILHYTRGLSGEYPMLSMKGKQIMLHQWIMQSTPQNEVVDHIDRNILNAQRSNLRNVNYSENAQNRSKVKSSSSHYFGVYVSKMGFKVTVQKDGKAYYGGYYKEEMTAGFAADQLSLMLYRDKVKSNGINSPGYIFKNNRAVKIEDVNFGESDSPECLYKRQKI